MGSDLNKNEAFNCIRFVPHILQTHGSERRQRVCCLAFVNTLSSLGLTSVTLTLTEFCIFIHRYGRILMYWSSTRCAGHCVTRKISALNIYSSQMMMLSKSGAFSTFCQKTNTHWSSSLKRLGRFLQLFSLGFLFYIIEKKSKRELKFITIPPPWF